MSDEHYISQAAAMSKLRRSDRQLRRIVTKYGIRTRRALGGRVLYHAEDVERVAAELVHEDDPPPLASVEIVPSSDLARRVEVLTDLLREAEQRAAQAETALRLLPPPERARQLEAEAVEARAEAAGLRQLLDAERAGSSRAWRLVAVLLVAVLLLALALAALALLH